MKNENLEKKYSPKDIEEKIYKIWMDKKAFFADPKSKKEPFTIIMPPPNITGKLHMGHALDISLQDSIIRYKRMKGYEVLWQPGTDHAAISTEIKIVEKLKSEGKTKESLGREEFLKEAWQWKEQYEDNIINQQKKIGASCDWDKLRFTLDEGCSKAVLKTFKILYDKNLIYKGDKMVNWCPVCHTTISDAEVIHKERDGLLYHIRYYFEDKNILLDGKNYIVVATTRPETILGDTAVAINPDDERYTHLLGKNVIVPIANRKVKIIADSYVDKSFGTGFVKMTPCHDINDFEVGIRHNLEKICILDDDGKIINTNSKYDSLDRFECRKIIVEDLEKENHIEKIEEHKHNIGTHDRCNTVIEPMIKLQWFVKMEPLAKPAIKVINDNILKFIPSNFENIYLQWLNNIKDWCISRQIWWGHRIPVYYCKDCGKTIVSEEHITSCTFCKSNNIYQDEDTLDTWFSSALWPFSTLGWPDENSENYKYFYKTNVLVTGYDIIFFWVIRMVFSGIELTGKCPFDEVLIHGIVRDENGKKMSKSLGNGIDPLDIVDKYGADALRISLLIGNSPGNDMRFYESRVEASRNFLNKIWNATRFIILKDNDKVDIDNIKFDNSTFTKLEDKWIISKLNNLIKEVTKNINNYDLGIALEKIQKFIWEEFCDWYIEFKKDILNNGNDNDKKEAIICLKFVLKNCLKILHPFAPFITEEIYSSLYNDGLVIKSEFPEFDEKLSFVDEENNIEYVKNIITSIRNRRAELNIPNKKKTDMYVLASSEKTLNTIKSTESFFKNLASISNIIFINDIKDVNDYICLTFEQLKIYLPFNELIDKEAEKEKIEKEINNVQFEIERAKKMLSNESFVKKAPEAKIDEEKNKLAKYEKLLIELKETLENF